MKSFPAFTLAPILRKFSASTDILSDSLIFKLAILVIFVVPFVKADRTAKVGTKSGVEFMSIVPRDLSFFAPVIFIKFFL